MEKIIVAAVAENDVIGKDGGLPWHYPEDMEHFREVTMGYPVIMGRRTYESLPDEYRPLPGRTNIVLTRSGIDDESALEANSLDDAWEKAAEMDDRAYIIGGATVYEQTLEDADRMIITRIHEEYDGDSFFPEVEWDRWNKVEQEERDELSFVEYEAT